jgi:hypothetical protein
MLQEAEQLKSTVTSTTSSVPVSSSPQEQPLSTTAEGTVAQRYRAHSHQDEHSVDPLSPYDSFARHSKFEPALSPVISLHLEFPPRSVHPAWTEKDIESWRVQEEEVKQDSHGYPRPHAKPNWLRRFCHHWLTAYRVLIALTLVINVLMMGIVIGLYHSTGGALVGTAVNLLASVLIRQEDLINVSFGLVARLPSTLPLGIRKVIADFHHFGGVHIGCAVSSLLWYIVFVAINTLQCVGTYKEGMMTGWHWTDITTCYAFLLFILTICVTALPPMREKFHNTFEHTHRFAGWASLTVLWINSGIHTRTVSGALPLHKSPALWLLAATTFLIVLPWLRIRRVAITSTPLSAREVKLTFPYANMPYTSTCRFSSAPLTEWHAFATIPAPCETEASIIVSAAGDWTKDLIANPPKTLWIRRPPTANFLMFAPLFNSVLLIATGAGIGPMLSLLSSPAVSHMLKQGKRVRVLWCVYDPYAAHWSSVLAVIKAVDQNPLILDSKLGRPDLAFEARDTAEREGIEAVMCVSNKKVTDGVVRELRGAGKAAYGAVFDS